MSPDISVFTPTHGDSKFLGEAWASLEAQDTDDWEWVVLVNNSELDRLPVPDTDPRVKVIYDHSDVQGVGAAKRAAVEQCSGKLLVELDHDDMLAPDALSEVRLAFDRHPEASMVYSRFAQVRADGTPHPQRFDPAHGWEYDVQAGAFQVPRGLSPTPHNVSLIWYAPNHLRAFTNRAYASTPGYDCNLRVLDDQALMSELYRVGPFVGLDKLLYYQRIHGDNTQLDLETNQQIQTQTWDLYEQNIQANYLAWCARNSLRHALNPKDVDWPNPWKCGTGDPPNSYGYIRCESFAWVEDLGEIWRMLAPNGMISIDIKEGVPYNEHYFRAWCATDKAPFQESRIRTYLDSNGNKRTQANLIAVKEGYVREGGILYARGY